MSKRRWEAKGEEEENGKQGSVYFVYSLTHIHTLIEKGGEEGNIRRRTRWKSQT